MVSASEWVIITIITSAITTIITIITISDAGAKDADGALALFLPFSRLGGPQQMAISAVEHGIGP
jgi:hypothetical protein